MDLAGARRDMIGVDRRFKNDAGTRLADTCRDCDAEVAAMGQRIVALKALLRFFAERSTSPQPIGGNLTRFDLTP